MTIAAGNMSQNHSSQQQQQQLQPQHQQPPQTSKTVKRHPNAAEPSRAELLKYLACLEGELAARDAAIADLREQRRQQLLNQARCGRYGLADPFAALQRDSEVASESSASDFDEAALKSMYDSQLAALENLIDTQRRAQQRMRDQMVLAERRYRRVCAELDEERRKHEKDAAEGDDVLAGLEKERERLKSEVEYERQQSRKLDREVAKISQALADERALSERQRRVALELIRDRRSLAARLQSAQHKCQLLEHAAVSASQRAAAAAAAAAPLPATSPQSPQPPKPQQQQQPADEEKAGLLSRLDSERARGKELAVEVDRLRALLAAATHPASQPGGLLKVKPEPPLRRTPKQQQQQQQQQQVCAVNGK